MSRMTIGSVFGMDRKKEIDGVIFEYPGNIRFTLARAGGGNDAFAKAYERHMRPYRTMQKTPGGIPEAIQRKIVVETYLDAVIKKVETNVSDDIANPDWQEIIELPEGPVQANRKGIQMALEMFPDLLSQVIADAGDLSAYRKAAIEADSGN